ncbi:MAG TPA: hypothetical protein PK698_06505 [Bacilli bacterium]|nr:hypothetical protein [Bacilli bacterium]
MEKLRKQDTGFTQVANKVLNDPNISLKSKGLYSYLYSKPNNWDFAVGRIKLDHKDNDDAIYSGIKELEEFGLLKRKKLSNGRVVYDLLIKPIRENPKLGKSQTGKIPDISNTELYNNTELDSNTSTQSGDCIVKEMTYEQKVSDIINEFKPINPVINFGNITQRKSVDILLKEFSYEELKAMVKITIKHQGKPYMPTITTPWQFKEKIGDIKVYFNRLKNKANKSKITSI